MGRLLNIKKVPFEIAAILAKDVKLKKLLLDDKPDALTASNVSYQIVLPDGTTRDYTAQDLIDEKYIWVHDPILEYAIKKFERHTVIIISLESINPYSVNDNILGTGAIFVITSSDTTLLEGNKFRALEMADQIDILLNNKKLSSAGILTISSFDEVIYNEFSTGCRINFSIADQINIENTEEVVDKTTGAIVEQNKHNFLQ